MYKKLFKVSVSMVCLLAVSFSFAQQKNVKGNVSDEEGFPLLGASITVKGSSIGTQTDFDGNYSISVSRGSILLFSYLGMKTKSVVVAEADEINIVMEGAASKLEEVVVLGYGETTKKAFTGTIKKVDRKNVESKNVTDISSALAGEIAGVRVINTTGQPGRVATIRIRGFGSVNGSKNPLYVVDGVPFSGSLIDINPSDIESTIVLKDAAATSIYGSRGASGVVLINTKKGTQEPYVEIETRIGQNANLIPRYDVIDSPEEYIGFAWESLLNKGVIREEANPVDYANKNLFSGSGISPAYNIWNQTDVSQLINPDTRKFIQGNERKFTPESWEDFGIVRAIRSETNLRMGGGNKNTSYFTSLGYLNDVGYLINTSYRRFTGRVNIKHKVKEWLDGSMNMGYSLAQDQNNGQSSDSGSVFWFLDNIPRLYPLFLRDDAGNFVKDTYYGGDQYDYGTGRGFAGLTNAIADATLSSRGRKYRALNGSVAINIRPFKGFSIENRLGVQNRTSNYTTFRNPFYGPSASQGGSVYKSNDSYETYNLLTLLRYKYTKKEHNVTALAAHEFNESTIKNISASGSGLGLALFNVAELDNTVANKTNSSYLRSSSIDSYFGQLNYDYNGKYYAQASIRTDGSSKFVNNKWGTFGALGLSWVASKEPFMENINIIEFLKVKSSYGIVGNQALDIGGASNYYPGYDHYDINNLNDKPSFSFKYKGNPDLTWETSKMFQTGMELTLGKYASINLDYYHKTTDNLVYPVRVGPSSGYAILYSNDGALVNQGVEFDITGHLIKSKDFELDLSLNGQSATSVITRLPIDPATGLPKTLDISGSFARSDGRSIYDYYMRAWAGVDPNDGAPQWEQYYDDKNDNGTVDSGEGISSLFEYELKNENAKIKKNITKNYSEATQKYINKTAIPDVTGGINLSSSYKGITLRVQALYGLGGYSYDFAYAGLLSNGNQAGGNNYHVDIRNRWQKPGDITNVPRIVSNEGNDRRASSTSSRFLIRSDYIQLNNISVGYTLPKKISRTLKMNRIYISFSADNLSAITARRGFIPITSETGSTSRYTYSPLSTYSLAIKLKF